MDAIVGLSCKAVACGDNITLCLTIENENSIESFVAIYWNELREQVTIVPQVVRRLPCIHSVHAMKQVQIQRSSSVLLNPNRCFSV